MSASKKVIRWQNVRKRVDGWVGEWMGWDRRVGWDRSVGGRIG